MYKVCLPDIHGEKIEIAIFITRQEALNYCYHRWTAPNSGDLCNDDGTIDLVTEYKDLWCVVLPLANGHIKIDQGFSSEIG